MATQTLLLLAAAVLATASLIGRKAPVRVPVRVARRRDRQPPRA